MSARENALERQRRFAWAKYYEAMRDGHETAIVYVARQVAITQDPTLPAHIKNEIEEMATAMRKQYECPICLDMIPSGQLDITNCGHKYCKTCLAQVLAQVPPKCSVCRKELKRS
jgi:hypothetical protein